MLKSLVNTICSSNPQVKCFFFSGKHMLLTVDLLTIDKDDAITKWSYYNPPFLEYAISQN